MTRMHVLLLACVVPVTALTDPPSVSAQADDSCETRGTAVYFGNGVNVSALDADAVTRDSLPGLAQEAGYSEPLAFRTAYNQTMGLFTDVIETMKQKAAEDDRFTWFMMNNVVGYVVRGLNVPTNLLGALPGGAAFVAQLQGVVNLAIAESGRQSTAYYDADVVEHVRHYASDLRAGNRILVVPHSQGNLYANAARTQVFSLAPSHSGAFAIGAVGTPAEDAFDGYVTSDNDLVIGTLRSLGRTVLPSNVHVPLSVADFLGHGFEEIYINARLPARGAVVSNLAAIEDRLPFPDVPCPPAAPSGPSLHGTNVTFSAHCCSAPPTDQNLIGAIRYGTVGSSVEFPDIAGSRGGVFVIAADIDVHHNSIEITYNTNASSVAGSFNGYVLDFSGAEVPTILSAEFGAGTTINTANTGIEVSGHGVHISLPSTRIVLGDKLIVDLTMQ